MTKPSRTCQANPFPLARALAAAWLLASSTAAADLSARQDTPGSADHPMISRYPGSVIVNYEQREYDEYTLARGPARRGERGWEHREPLELEGRLTRIRYAAPAERSTLEVFRNYEAALRSSGFEIVATCKGDDCGDLPSLEPRMIDDRGTDLMGKDLRFLAASARSADGDVHLSLLVLRNDVNWMNGHPVVQLDVVESEPMATGLVDVDLDAASMARSLAAEGRVSIYGIYFDFDEATLKPESRAALEEIARLMRTEPSLNVHVVGHTDAVGGFEYNQELSLRRARAVVAALTGPHAIEARRLTAHGVASLAPVASNDSEEGRALNRRVELVKR